MTIFYPVPELFPDERARFIQVANTAGALASVGVRVVLLAGVRKGFAPADIPGFYGLEGNKNLEVVSVPMMRGEKGSVLRVSWHGLYNRSVVKRIAGYGADDGVILVRHLKLASYLLKHRARLGMPVVFEVHEIFHLSTTDAKKRESLMRLEERVYGRADLVLALTERLKAEISERFPKVSTPVCVVPHGVRLPEESAARGGAGGYICYAGSLYEWKGVDVLIQAMKYMPDARLVVVGGGGRLDELKRLASDTGVADRVDFVGQVPHSDVAGYLSQAAVAVLPNIDEGQSMHSSPLKLFEYLASGLPVVATDLPGFSEVVTDGVDAVLVRPGDPAALAQGIREVIEDKVLSARLSGAARTTAENYSYQRRAERIVEAIGSIRG